MFKVSCECYTDLVHLGEIEKYLQQHKEMLTFWPPRVTEIVSSQKTTHFFLSIFWFSSQD